MQVSGCAAPLNNVTILASAAAGTSGPSAEGMRDAERSAAAQEVLLLNLVLPEGLQEADMWVGLQGIGASLEGVNPEPQICSTGQHLE